MYFITSCKKSKYLFKQINIKYIYLLFSVFTLDRVFFIHIFLSRAFTLNLIVLFLSHGVTIKPKSTKEFSIPNILSKTNQIRTPRKDEE